MSDSQQDQNGKAGRLYVRLLAMWNPVWARAQGIWSHICGRGKGLWSKAGAQVGPVWGKVKVRAIQLGEKAQMQAGRLWVKARVGGARTWKRVQWLAAAGWDQCQVFFGKARVAVARHPISPLLYVTVLSVAVGAIVFNGMYSRAYVLNVGGEEVGVIADQEELDAIVSKVETRVSSILGEDYDYDVEITLTPAYTTASEVSDTQEVEENLFDTVGALVDAYAISVDGYELGYALTQGELERMLDEIIQPYLTESTIRHSFAESVEIYPMQVPANTSFDLEVLKNTLTSYEVQEAHYVIESGDTFNAIAYSLDMTPAQLKELNPEVDANRIFVGQELVIQQAVPYLSVVTVTNETYEEPIESPVEYIETASLYVGQTSVKEQGVDGVAQVNAEVTYRNGAEQVRTVLSTTTVQQPTTTYIYKGTTPKPVTASNGYFVWPVGGSITSYYGGRYIFGGYDFHLGLDIACPYGTAIKAADGGTVTYAGWRGSYGMLVIITHDNGTQTYYAHNSSLLVSAGDKVYQGQAIARAGMTGSATGYHCHFEVRVNGSTVNPLNYL